MQMPEDDGGQTTSASIPAEASPPPGHTPIFSAHEGSYSLQVFDLGEGAISYLEMGVRGKDRPRLSRDQLNTKTPHQNIRRAFPNAIVPEALRGFPAPSSGEGSVSETSEEGVERITRAALESYSTPIDERESGCPYYVFHHTMLNICSYPEEQPNSRSLCRLDVEWAFNEHTRAVGGELAVCTDVGTALVEVTEKNKTTSFTVPVAMFARYFVTRSKTCGLFSCSTERKRIKFDLKPNGNSTHFASTIYF
jgi:hypothetical protein